jgi:hypothetical protein
MPIELHAFDTPNGRKISVALEEMDLPYSVKIIDISKGQQFEPEFLQISPNGKIPKAERLPALVRTVPARVTVNLARRQFPLPAGSATLWLLASTHVRPEVASIQSHQ